MLFILRSVWLWPPYTRKLPLKYGRHLHMALRYSEKETFARKNATNVLQN